jgi:hypothetical protein
LDDFIYQQLSKQTLPAGQGASTVTTFTLLGPTGVPTGSAPTIFATLTTCLGGAGYDTAGSLGTLAWTISAGNLSNGTAGAYTFVPTFGDPANGVEQLAKQINDYFAGVDVGAEGKQILHAVNTIGKTASYDITPFADKGGSGGIAPTPVQAPTFDAFTGIVVSRAIDAARRNAAGVGINTYPNGAATGLTLGASGSVGFANAKTGSSDAYGQLAGNTTSIEWARQEAVNGVVDYTAIANESEGVFAQAMTAALAGGFSGATLGSQAVLMVGNSSTAYLWTGMAPGQ